MQSESSLASRCSAIAMGLCMRQNRSSRGRVVLRFHLTGFVVRHKQFSCTAISKVSDVASPSSREFKLDLVELVDQHLKGELALSRVGFWKTVFG